MLLQVFLLAVMVGAFTLAEMVTSKGRQPLRSRFPGALFLIGAPITGILMAPLIWPLWDALGVPQLADLSGWNPLAVVVIMLFARDFTIYWQHRLNHWLLWPMHAVHHSVEDLNVANGYGHPLETVTEILFIAIPLSLVDTGGVGAPLAAQMLIRTQALMCHSTIPLHYGPLRSIFVDNRFHRIHHSLEERHFDKNFGIVFTVWDRIFGTAYWPKEDEWPATGVAGLKQPRNIREWLLQPLQHFKGDARA